MSQRLPLLLRSAARGSMVPLSSTSARVELITSRAVVCELDDQLDNRSDDRPDGPVDRFVLLDDTRPQPLSPMSAVVHGLSDAGVRLDDRISITDGVLELGRPVRFAVDLAAAPLWCPPRASLDRAALRRLADELTAWHSTELMGARRRLEGRLGDVTASLSTGDQHHLRDAVRAVVGFGPGLTPSGDDALVGLLSVLGATRLDAANVMHRRLATALGPLVDPDAATTTRYSACVLRLAATGDNDEAVADALDGAACRPNRLPAALRRLVATGATSGADIAHGMLAAIEVVSAAPVRLDGAAR